MLWRIVDSRGKIEKYHISEQEAKDRIREIHQKTGAHIKEIHKQIWCAGWFIEPEEG